MKNICVFCGSSVGEKPEYKEVARQLGTLMGQMGFNLVYGGGRAGLMGVVANAVLEAGGHVSGIITDRLVTMEVAHTGLTDLRVVTTMHERKAAMAELADGFIALPGGIGTLEELFMVWTEQRLKIHNKSCGLLNVSGFYNKMIEFLDYTSTQGFLPEAHRELLLVESEPRKLLERMLAQGD